MQASEIPEAVREDDAIKLQEAFAHRIPLEAVRRAGGDESGWRKMLVEASRKAIVDPFRYGFRNRIWDLAEEQIKQLRSKFAKGVIYLILLGGHRSSKSEWASWFTVKNLVGRRGSRWWAADATEAASRDNQQRYIERYLPVEWRPGESGVLDKRRSKITKVRFSQAGGFTENALVLPNRSECRFKFYEQKLSTLQAVALDGFWGDELLPFEWIEEVDWRLAERNGLFLATFTPYEYWTQTVGYFLEGARVLEEVPADSDLLPLFQKDHRGKNKMERSAEMVHRVLQCENPRARVIYFHSSDNPIFGNWEALKAKAARMARPEIRMRIYGMVEKGAFAQFPLFNVNVHVITTKKFQAMRKEWDEGDRFHMVDPCSGRLWFMIWVWCPKPKTWIIYREFPSTGHPGAYIDGIGDPGPWAVFGEAEDGAAGPAQKNRGFGLERYRDETQKLEGNEVISERWIDARYANSPREEREGTTTLIEQMVDVGMEFRAMVSETKILGVNDGSIDMINSALYYDQDTPIGKFSEDLGRVNEPQLYVLDTCPNTIWALRNWTGKDGVHGACKDPIDVIRGMFLSQVGFTEAGMYAWSR